MRNVGFILLTLIPASIIACKKNEEQPPPQSGYQQPYPQQQQYPQQQYPQQQYPQQQQPGYAQPAPTTPAPAGTAPATTLSTPDATAFPCQSDAQCVTHRCNTQYGKCAYPCRADTDCAPGNRCMTPLCVPGTGAPPAQ